MKRAHINTGLAGSLRHPTLWAGSLRHPTLWAGSLRHPTLWAGSIRHPTLWAGWLRHPTLRALGRAPQARRLGGLSGFVHGTAAIQDGAAQGTLRLFENIIG